MLLLSLLLALILGILAIFILFDFSTNQFQFVQEYHERNSFYLTKLENNLLKSGPFLYCVIQEEKETLKSNYTIKLD